MENRQAIVWGKAMPAQVYKDMLEVMIRRGGPYSGADVPEFYALVETLFTPEEARVNNALPRRPATAAEIAKGLGRDETETRAVLEGMADKGLCATFLEDKERVYQGVAFMPGIFEYQFMPGRSTDRERKIAFLIQAYKKAYLAAKGAPRPGFPLTRVITVDRKIRAGNRVHTYDQVATYIDKNESIGVGTCFCRHAAALRGEDTHGAPMDVCMWFGPRAEYAVERLGTRKVTKQEAREVLDRAEEAGLVHMSRNTTDEIDFLCNCDRWHCEVVNPILKYPKPGLLFNSGFSPRFDPGQCSACETCIERCPSGALSMGPEDVPVADMDRCFGCAVCASGCPSDAIEMEAKPGRPEPPKTVKDLVTALKGAR
jgi:Pyruvate/2-oxoacid:ferredoxin oxidoreductase delta subunit